MSGQMKYNISVGYSNLLKKYKKLLINKTNYLELYLDPDQYYKNYDEVKYYKNINLLFNYIPNLTDNLKNYKKYIKIAKDIEPQIITVGSYILGKILVEEGFKVEASIILNVDNIEKISELKRIGFYGYALSSYKIYDFDLIKESKKYFPDLRVKIIANMMCPTCIYYSERHTLLYLDKSAALANTLINNLTKCKKNILKTSIVWPSIADKWLDVDIFKFASRRDRIEVWESIKNFVEEDDYNYVYNMAAYFLKDSNLYNSKKDLKEVVDFFFKHKKLCDFNCFKCPYNCNKKWTTFLK